MLISVRSTMSNRYFAIFRRHEFYSLFGTAQIQVRTADVAGVILAAGLLLPPLLIG